MIEYLIKFVKKEKYADDFLNGKLFMHSANYYHKLEKQKGPGQGDVREGQVISDVYMYRFTGYLIFCMFIVDEADITDNKIRISQHVLKDFDCDNGYCIIVKAKDFFNLLSCGNCDGFGMEHSRVEYRRLTIEDINDILVKNECTNLFVKNPYFHYQNEYRIVVFKDVPKDKAEKGYYCRLKKPTKSFAKKEFIKELISPKGEVVIDLQTLFDE